MCCSSQLHFTNHPCGEAGAGISGGLSCNIQSKKERNECIHVHLLAQPSSLLQFRRQLGLGVSYSGLDLLTSISFIKTIPKPNVDNPSLNESPQEILKLYCVELKNLTTRDHGILLHRFREQLILGNVCLVKFSARRPWNIIEWSCEFENLICDRDSGMLQKEMLGPSTYTDKSYRLGVELA